jgi:hypothetical protein
MKHESLTIELTTDEQVLAGLLTRDAWTYFSSMIGTQNLSHVKDIPLTPRRGTLEITSDPDVLHYYLCFADAYSDELVKGGWDAHRCAAASSSLITKLESVSGLTRGEIQHSGDS